MPDRRFTALRQIGLLSAIPMLMVVAPLLGLWGGQWVERRLHVSPWGSAVGVGLGFFAAVREIRNILRKVKSELEDPRNGSGHGS